MLSVSIESIFASGTAPYPFEKLYKTVTHLCHLKHESEAYEGLHIVVKNNVDQIIQNDICPFVEDGCLLFNLSKVWKTFHEKIDLIRAIYLELDRTNVNGSICYSVWEMALNNLKQTLLPNTFIMNKVNEAILKSIRLSRNGNQIPTDEFKIIIEMLDDLGYFQARLESKILEQTKTFFYEESKEKIAQFTLSEYVKYIINVMKSENDFFKDMCPMILEQNRLILASQLIGEHKQTILHNKELTTSFKELEFDLIKQIYQLFQMIPGGTDRFNEVFSVYIRDRGLEIVKSDKDIIQELLDFKEQTDNILLKSFDSHEPFGTSIQNAFKKIINTNCNRVAELLAKYIDSKLRTGYKDFSEKQFECLLDKVMLFFRYNDCKDIFEAFYKQYLSKRLLIGKSASVDAEKTMLTKLKIECGHEFTITLEGMFKDLEISRDLNEHFSRSLALTKLSPKIDMIVNTLTENNWPNRPVYSFHLPAFMQNYEEAFTKFYLAKFASRKLTWGRDLGHCLLTFNLNNVSFI